MMPCPGCGYRHDMATQIPTQNSRRGAPDDGAVSICLNCGHVTIFDSTVDGGMRAPTQQELVEVMSEPSVTRVIGSILARGILRT